MRAVIIDDEPLSAAYLEDVCAGLAEVEIAAVFGCADEALRYLRENRDIALVFTDIEMPGLSGLDAARALRAARPDVAVVFVTGYEQYALEAFNEQAADYLLKPCGEDEVRRAVRRARLLAPARAPRAEIRTFGRFALIVDGEPYRFANAKAGELLALAVDRRGGVVTMEQAADALWEHRPYDETVKQLYRKAVMHLHRMQREKGLDFFVSNRGSCHILPAKVDCDYFRLLDGDPRAREAYCGAYLSDYGWAEDTVGYIERLLGRL